MQVSVVRDRKSRHAVRLGPLQQFPDGARTIKKAVMSMAMEVREWTSRRGRGFKSGHGYKRNTRVGVTRIPGSWIPGLWNAKRA